MSSFVLIDMNTNKVIAEENCLGNAMEHVMVLEEMGMKIRVEEVTQETVG